MQRVTTSSSGIRLLHELAEFAAFAAPTQAYIRHALEVRSACREARSPRGQDADSPALAARMAFYGRLDEIASAIPVDDDLRAVTGLMQWLVPLTTFDIAHAAMDSFAAYRFLYERLLGAAVRPWLLGAFCTAAAYPQLHPAHRVQLLRSIGAPSELAHGWSICEPSFYPQPAEHCDA